MVFSILSVVPVMVVVAGVERKASADCASDQGAERSADETPCHTTTRGLIPGGRGPERCAGAEARDQLFANADFTAAGEPELHAGNILSCQLSAVSL